MIRWQTCRIWLLSHMDTDRLYYDLDLVRMANRQGYNLDQATDAIETLRRWAKHCRLMPMVLVTDNDTGKSGLMLL